MLPCAAPNAQCITKWTDTQRYQLAVHGPGFHCPLCKRPYTSIIHDCQDTADFVRRWVVDQSAGPSFAPETLQLTVAHRRRRGVYSTALDAAEQERVGQVLLTPELVSRLEVGKWVERELQALMQTQDVALVAAHLTGTLRAAVQPGAAAPSAGDAAPQRTAVATNGAVTRPVRVLQKPRLVLVPGARAPVARPAGLVAASAVVPVLRAAQPLLFEKATRFSWEMAAFVASGQSMAAYDQQAMQAGSAAAAQAVAEARRQLQRRQEWWREEQQQEEEEGQQGQEEEEHSGGRTETAAAAARPPPRARSSSASSGGASSGQLAEAQRSDSEGYLELLMQQGRQRRSAQQREHHQHAEQEEQQQQPEQQPQHRSQELQEVDGAEASGQFTGAAGGGGSVGEHRRHKRRRGERGTGGRSSSLHAEANSSRRSVGEDVCGTSGEGASHGHPSRGSPAASTAPVLAALRQRALASLHQHRSAYSQAGGFQEEEG